MVVEPPVEPSEGEKALEVEVIARGQKRRAIDFKCASIMRVWP